VPDVQLEHGFTRIADALYEALIRAPLPGRHQRVAHALIRLTFGYGKKADRISSGQLAGLTGLAPGKVRDVLSDLVRWGMVERKGSPGTVSILALVKDFDRWKIAAPAPRRGRPANGATRGGGAPRKGQTRPANGAEPAPRTGHTKENRHSSKDKAGIGARAPSPRRRSKPKGPSPQDAWPRIREAFAAYGVTMPPKLRKAWAASIGARMAEYRGHEVAAVVAGVHGYVGLHGLEVKGDWEPGKHFNPGTIFRPSKFPKYIGAYSLLKSEGKKPPFPRTTRESAEAREARLMKLANERAARAAEETKERLQEIEDEWRRSQQATSKP
jgi:phage replication O-like protein O